MFPLVSASWCHALRSRARRFESCRGALVICTNSNALTTLTQPKPRPLNCGDPACAGPYGQNAVSPRKGVRHHERAEDLHTGGAGRRAVL
jgi:hypothetical protein